MTAPDLTPEAIAAGLSEDRRRDLVVHWYEFSDADPLSYERDQGEFLADMEEAGFVEIVPVDDDALDDPFAWERGIEPGGMMYRLTPLGLAVRAILSGDAK